MIILFIYYIRYHLLINLLLASRSDDALSDDRNTATRDIDDKDDPLSDADDDKHGGG